jgi:Na+-transporting NADH:ubiquinone oxidoreductase subunit NqrB
MNNQRRIDWHLTVAVIALLITFVAAIPTVYNFEKRKFFWQADLPKPEVPQKSNDSIF